MYGRLPNYNNYEHTTTLSTLTFAASDTTARQAPDFLHSTAPYSLKPYAYDQTAASALALSTTLTRNTNSRPQAVSTYHTSYQT